MFTATKYMVWTLLLLATFSKRLNVEAAPRVINEDNNGAEDVALRSRLLARLRRLETLVASSPGLWHPINSMDDLNEDSINNLEYNNLGDYLMKRNYNLDHLARMNFRRSYRASKFNNRHILGGLKK